MEEIKSQLQRLTTEQTEIKRRIDKLEDNDARHEKDIKQLYVNQEGTKVYVTQILQKIDALETKLFNALTSAGTNTQKERQNWMDLIKYVIGITIGAIVMYVFSTGGGIK